MTDRNLLAALPVAALAVLVGLALRRPAPPAEPPPPYRIEAGTVVLAPGSKLLDKLEIETVGPASRQSAELRAVGQIIALSNASGALTGEGVVWVELEPALTASLDLKLGGGEPAGVVYGVTNIPAEYAGRVHAGQTLSIARYGLKRGGVAARIEKMVPVEGDGFNVVFRFAEGRDWFPGTNCEASFPVLQGYPVKIPTTAPVHEGTREFVWKELAPGRLEAQVVSMVDATADEVSVLGLRPGDRIVARGSILLKPLLSELSQGKD